MKVAVDREAGDGRAGDDDRIGRSVETVLGSTFDDELTGDDRAQTLAGGDGDDRITGGAGEDVLSATKATTASRRATASSTPSTVAATCSTGGGRPHRDLRHALCRIAF